MSVEKDLPKRQIFTILKWLKAAYPDGPLEDAIPGEECIERVRRGYCSSVPEAEALLSIIYEGKEGKELLYAGRSTHKDHEELAFMLQFLSLLTDMWYFEEEHFKERCRLEERVIAVDKYYASLK